MPTQRDKLKPIVNVPIVVQLETLGQEVSSHYNGTEWRYDVLHENRPAFIYLPVDGRSALLNAHATRGDLVEIIKQKRGNQFTYNAHVISDAAEPEPAAGVRMVAPKPTAASGSTAARVGPAPAPQSNGHSAETPRPLEDLMAGCLIAGARANLRAHKHLRDAGIEIDGPTWEDVRATGISFFIQRMRDGGAQ